MILLLALAMITPQGGLPLLRGAQEVTDADVMTDADRKPKTVTNGDCFITGATIMTVSDAGTIENGRILVRDGKIAAVGAGIEPPEGVTVIDARGLVVIPGIVDCHSHIAMDATNEGTLSLVPEVRVADALDPTDVAIWRAAAGGCTSASVLHGSANPIGGQNAVVKMKYGVPPGEYLFPGAPRGVKFALGENVKQSNWSRRTNRFPQSRMGVEAVFRRAFTEAVAYRKKWGDFRAGKSGKVPPRRDTRLDLLVDILDGNVRVHTHCYRADEILMILRVAEDFGFKIATLQHVLEGYKVAPEIARHGAGGSTFADWWAFKIEAYDAIPYNAALMAEAGVRVSINSDSDDFIRRLNQEAAKVVKYGRVPEEEALRMITLNPALQLGIGDRVGSIEKGKDADLALHNGHPFSIYSRCVMTLIDGEVVFEEPGVARNGGFDVATRRRADPPKPRRDPRGAYAIVNAHVFPVSSAPVEGATVLIRDGRIAAVGRDVKAPKGVTRIDATGLRVYPGLIDAGTHLGLTEISSVRGTRDDAELGDVQPDLVSATAFHADSAIVPVTRANGITTVATGPRNGLIGGQASLMALAGWTREEMTRVDRVALLVNFPVPPVKKKDEDKKGAELRRWFEEALRYDEAVEAGTPVPHDLRLEALVPYAKGEGLVIFRVDAARGIRAAVAFGESLKLRYAVGGGDGAWRVASLLKEKGVDVILGSPFSHPDTRFDRYDSQFQCAARLHAAGVRFAFTTGDASNVRNLPYLAGTAAAFGLPREAALRAVILAPAEILGVDGETGSLAKGKRADLIVTTGDPLEIVTDVVHMFVGGEPVSLENRHTGLYRRYRGRLRGDD